MTHHPALVGRLETENRRLKVAIVGVLALTAGAALTAQLPPPEHLTAQEFVLVSDTGEVRARLNIDRGPALRFYDEDGELTMVLGMGRDGPVLGAMGPDGEPRNYLSPEPDRVPLR